MPIKTFVRKEIPFVLLVFANLFTVRFDPLFTTNLFAFMVSVFGVLAFVLYQFAVWGEINAIHDHAHRQTTFEAQML